VFCFLLGQLGIVGAAPSVPVAPGALPFDAPAAVTVTAVVLVLALSVLLWTGLVRRLGLGARPDPGVAGLSILLVALVLGAIVWIGNPYAALLLIPALHLGLLLASPEWRPRRIGALALLTLALLPLALLITFYARQEGMAPGELAWSAVLLLVGGHMSLSSTVLWSVALGCALAAGVLAARSPSQTPDPREDDGIEVTIRGPMSYAGPGSLGGTESALRR
jgi:hypothetical protein